MRSRTASSLIWPSMSKGCVFFNISFLTIYHELLRQVEKGGKGVEKQVVVEWEICARGVKLVVGARAKVASRVQENQRDHFTRLAMTLGFSENPVYRATTPSRPCHYETSALGIHTYPTAPTSCSYVSLALMLYNYLSA